MTSTSRRTILLLSGIACATAGVALVSTFGAEQNAVSQAELILAERLQEVVPPAHRIRSLGQAHLATLGRNATVSVVLNRLFPGAALAAALAASNSELGRELKARVSEDYGSGQVVNVSGWLVSHTEALVCALSVALERHEQTRALDR